MPLATTPRPTGTRQLTVWADGQLLDEPNRPIVSASDHGLVVGGGVFEALKITQAGPFAVRRHLDRLARSAIALGLPPPDQARIRAAIDEVMEHGGEGFGRLRITYTGGRGTLTSHAPYGPPTLVVAAEPADLPAASAVVVTSPWTRNENGALAGVKSISYAENVRTLAFANARGATETILLNTAGRVCEGTGTNVFVIRDGRVVTPPLTAGPLAGITRELILEWCEVEERDFSLAEALAADEVFLTSSLRDVQTVRRWDEADFEQTHQVTDEIAATFAVRSKAEIDP